MKRNSLTKPTEKDCRGLNIVPQKYFIDEPLVEGEKSFELEDGDTAQTNHNPAGLGWARVLGFSIVAGVTALPVS